MKKIALAAALSLATTSAFAGGAVEPVMEPEVVAAQTASSSGGVVIPLSTTNVDSGTVTFKAPTVTQDTDVALECVVSANSKTATTPATLKILKPTP